MKKIAVLFPKKSGWITTLLLSLIFLTNVSAQVYQGDLTLQTQAQVDNFNFTSVTGYLLIGSGSGSNTNITNLNALSELTSVGGDLTILYNQSLPNINGLSNLISVGEDLVIFANAILTNIDGLSSLNSVGGLVGGDVDITGNPSLTDFCGLFNLFNSGTYGTVIISNNASNPTVEDILVECQLLGEPPVAICQDVTVSTNANCQAIVTPQQVDNDSYDPNGDEITFSLSPEGPYSLGETEVTLTVSDLEESSTCTATITVIDNTPPSLAAISEPIVLSPNLLFETIDVSELVVSVSDNCSSISLADVYIVSVSSDEVAGLTTDIVIGQDCKSVKLRRERHGLLPLPLLNGNGRVYTITLGVSDGNENINTATCQVTVPFGNNPAVDDGAAYTVNSNCVNGFAKITGDESSVSIIQEIPEEFGLDQNYPNPFNPNTIIRWQLPVASHIDLKVYDVLGNEVVTLVNENKEAGYYEVMFDATTLASGTYIYRLSAGDPESSSGQVFISIKKMLLIK